MLQEVGSRASVPSMGTAELKVAMPAVSAQAQHEARWTSSKADISVGPLPGDSLMG